jgi:hypothetical protein
MFMRPRDRMLPARISLGLPHEALAHTTAVGHIRDPPKKKKSSPRMLFVRHNNNNNNKKKNKKKKILRLLRVTFK